MNNYGIDVIIEKIVCRDTESIHSSDRFGLAGFVITTGQKQRGFVLPEFRINSGETFPLYKKVFEGVGSQPLVKLGLMAWDIDENDSWVDNEEDIILASQLIAEGIKLIPDYGEVVGEVMDIAIKTIPPVIDKFVSWDKKDPLLHFEKWFDLSYEGPYAPKYQSLPPIRFQRDSPLDYSGFDYTLHAAANCTYAPEFSHLNPNVSQETLAMEAFKHRAYKAKEAGFVGGFPNFYEATYGQNRVGGTIFLNEDAANWHDLELLDLGNPELTEFSARMKATQDYAHSNGFVGGFPNFYHQRKPTPLVDNNGKPVFKIFCGTVLLNSNHAEWRDVPLSELGNPKLYDIGARFRGTHDYAVKHGFLGGFPNFYHADYGDGVVCGTILIKKSAGEWRDVYLYKVP